MSFNEPINDNAVCRTALATLVVLENRHSTEYLVPIPYYFDPKNAMTNPSKYAEHF